MEYEMSIAHTEDVMSHAPWVCAPLHARDWRAIADIYVHLFVLISSIFLWIPTSIAHLHANAHARLHKRQIFAILEEKR